jgi:putative hydrolase of the HAD superfamily
MNEIRAILFDLGNTLSATASLADSLVHLAQSPTLDGLRLDSRQLVQLGQEVERQIDSLYQDGPVHQPHWLDVWQAAISACGLGLDAGESERLCRAHLRQFLSECQVEPYSIPLLAALRQVGIPLGLVSNVTGPADLFDLDLREKGLASFFQIVVWSSAIGFRKPDSRIFRAALDGLQLSPGKSIFMVGDRERADVLGGKAMGFTTVRVVKQVEGTESVADYVVAGSDLLELFQWRSH